GPPPAIARKDLHLDMLASSGGFSDEVPIPSWQKPVLRNYYSRGPNTPAVSPYGRGFPDVAMMASGPAVQLAPGEPLSALGYQGLVGGQWIDFAGGTSIGAPIWAAIVACLNQARRAAGLGRLGFVNPLLYKLRDSQTQVFRQITQGNSDVAMNVVDTNGRAVPYRLQGFECRSGWNPVTGLGVPNVAALSELVCAPERWTSRS